MKRPTRIALLGVCNSYNTIAKASRNEDIIVEPYIFQPSLLDITCEGLNIPYRDFYKVPPIPGENATAIFTKKTMQFDLNKTALRTIESLNPDYLCIDLSSLTMRTYKVSYKGKTVFSVNAYSPACYEHLVKAINGLSFERCYPSRDFMRTGIERLVRYLKSNWRTDKLILFDYNIPTYYRTTDSTIEKYPTEGWAYEQAVMLKELTKYFHELFPEVRVFSDSQLKVSDRSWFEQLVQTPCPSPFHCCKYTEALQSLLFREFLLKEDLKQEIEEVKQKLQDRINKVNKLTIVIPTYNSESFIEDCFKCLRKQTNQNFNVIFVDDGSTDGTVELLRKYQVENFQACAYVKENEGPGPTRSFGMSKVRSEYFTFLDPDDSISANYVDSILRNIHKPNLYLSAMYTDNLCEVVDKPEVNTTIASETKEKTFLPLDVNRLVFKTDVVKNNKLQFCNTSFYEGELFCIDYLQGTQQPINILGNAYHIHYKRPNSLTRSSGQVQRIKDGIANLESYKGKYNSDIDKYIEETLAKARSWIRENS